MQTSIFSFTCSLTFLPASKITAKLNLCRKVGQLIDKSEWPWDHSELELLQGAHSSSRSRCQSHENPRTPSPKSKHPWSPTNPLNIDLTTSMSMKFPQQLVYTRYNSQVRYSLESNVMKSCTTLDNWKELEENREVWNRAEEIVFSDQGRMVALGSQLRWLLQLLLGQSTRPAL